jgi:hypothetical protein
VLDASVLYPARVRDLLFRLAVAGRYRALWTERILDECFSNLLADRPERVKRASDAGRHTAAVGEGEGQRFGHEAP